MRLSIFALALLFCSFAKAQPLTVSEGPTVSVNISAAKTYYADRIDDWFVFRFSPSVILRNLSDQTVSVPETDNCELALFDIQILDSDERTIKITRTTKELPSFRGKDCLSGGYVKPYHLPTEFDISVKKMGSYRIVLKIGISGKGHRQIRWLTSEPFEITVEAKPQN